MLKEVKNSVRKINLKYFFLSFVDLYVYEFIKFFINVIDWWIKLYYFFDGCMEDGEFIFFGVIKLLNRII